MMTSSLRSSLIILLLLPAFAHAQKALDSTSAYPMVSGCIGFQIPGAAMADRFGPSYSIGPAFLYKTSNNFLFGIDYNFIYSENVKNSESVFKGIATPDGNIIDGNGMFAEYFLYERAFLISGKVGKIIPLKHSNPNSGLMLVGSTGLLQHKIWIYSREETAPQISGDYTKGYDNLRNGLAINEFAGYFYASSKGKVNFFVGLEATQAWTKSRRSYNFSTMSQDNSTELDLLMGIKFGWVFPIYRTIPKDYYYY